MYLKDKNVRFTLRVSQEMADFIYRVAEDFYCSPSEAIRLILTCYKVNYKDLK